MRAKVPAVALPPDCFTTRRKLADGSWRVYYWHQPKRGAKDKSERGKLTRLPEPNTTEWFETLAELGAGAGTAESMAGLWGQYKTGPRWPKAAGSRRLYELTWKNHIAPAVGRFSAKKIEAVHIRTLRDKYTDAPTTSRTVLAVMSNLMNEAVERGIRGDNPAKSVRRLDVTPDSARPLTAAAWAALISPKAPEELRRYAYLARGTGQRISDILTMRPDMRTENGITHQIKKTNGRRNGAPHFSPIRPDFLAIIDGWAGFATRRYLHVKDSEPPSDASMRKLWKRYQETKAGKALVGFTFHDLRATNFCDELQEGFTTAEIAKRRGASEEIVTHYTRNLDGKIAAQASEKRVRGQR